MFEGLGFRLWNYEVEFDDIGAALYTLPSPDPLNDYYFIDYLYESTWEWSDELELAAKMYLKDLEGCNVYQPLIIDDGEANDYLSQFASFSQNRRFVLYPERMKWSEPEEFAMEFLFYQHSWVYQNAFLDVWNPDYNQIGIACSCHPTFGQVCVVQIGQSVAPYQVPHSHSTSNLTTPHIHPIEKGYTLNKEDYKFYLPGDKRCPTHKKEGFCGEEDHSK